MEAAHLKNFSCQYLSAKHVTLLKLSAMYTYDTVVDAINGLKIRGYTLDFNIAADQIICRENNQCLKHDEFEITEVHRFEGDTNPSDEDVVYAVESTDGKLKGVLTSAFGTYADDMSTEIIQKLSMHKPITGNNMD
jgi:hypothetical protein